LLLHFDTRFSFFIFLHASSFRHAAIFAISSHMIARYATYAADFADAPIQSRTAISATDTPPPPFFKQTDADASRYRRAALSPPLQASRRR
jgi:hypothetical protein